MAACACATSAISASISATHSAYDQPSAARSATNSATASRLGEKRRPAPSNWRANAPRSGITRTRISSLPSTGCQSRRYPGLIPKCCLISAGMVIVLVGVTVVIIVSIYHKNRKRTNRPRVHRQLGKKSGAACTEALSGRSHARIARSVNALPMHGWPSRPAGAANQGGVTAGRYGCPRRCLSKGVGRRSTTAVWRMDMGLDRNLTLYELEEKLDADYKYVGNLKQAEHEAVSPGERSDETAACTRPTPKRT